MIQFLLRQTVFASFKGDCIGQAIEFAPLPATKALVIFGGDQHGDGAFVPKNGDGFALGLIEDGGETLFGFGGGDGGHRKQYTLKLSKMDKMIKINKMDKTN